MRLNSISNVIVVLALLAMVIFLAIRLFSRSGEEQHDELRKQIAKAAQSSGSAEAVFPLVQDSIETVTRQYGSVEEKISGLSSRIRTLEEQLSTKGKEQDPDTNATPAVADKDTIWKRLTYNEQGLSTGMEPITLSPELQQVSLSLGHAGVVADWQFDEFLNQMIQAGALSADAPEKTKNEIRDLFSAFKTRVKLASVQQKVYAQMLMDESDLSQKNYIDIPPGTSMEDVRLMVKAQGGPGGYMQMRELEGGIQRRYKFSFEDFPGLLEFQNLWNNAKDHLIRDVDAVVKK